MARAVFFCTFQRELLSWEKREAEVGFGTQVMVVQGLFFSFHSTVFVLVELRRWLQGRSWPKKFLPKKLMRVIRNYAARVDIKSSG